MNRRHFIHTGALAGAGALVISETACAPKNLSFFVQTLIGAMRDLSPLIPGQGVLLSKIITIATDFDAAYKRGDFANATAIFNTLVGNVTQLINDIGSLSTQIKTILAVVGIALRAIASLLASQATPAIAAKAKGTPEGATVQRLSNPQVFDDILNSLKQ